MAPGKMSAQLGHAFVESHRVASQSLLESYHSDGMGTKVCLVADSLQDLLQAQELATYMGVPCALITDSGCPNFFEGKPTITALGVGPATKQQAKCITKKFKLL